MQLCYNHKNIETVLNCSRCNKPICNKCTTDSYVGIKCKDCGSIGKPDILNISIYDVVRVFSISHIFSLIMKRKGFLWINSIFRNYCHNIRLENMFIHNLKQRPKSRGTLLAEDRVIANAHSWLAPRVVSSV